MDAEGDTSYFKDNISKTIFIWRYIMKKMISVVLCVIIFASIFSVSAYAEGRFLLHKSKTEGVLTHGVWANSQNDGRGYYYPANSIFKLVTDLYSDDSQALITINGGNGNWSENTYVSVDIIYFFPDHVRIIKEAA